MSGHDRGAPRGGPVGPTVAVLGIVAACLLVWWLRSTAPVSPTDTSVPAAAAAQEDLLLCQDLAADDGRELPDPGRATSGEILTCPFEFDQLVVEYVGEVVGDVLQRDGGSWVLLNDDPYALSTGPLGAGGEPSGTNSGMSVWLPDPLDELATTPGRAGVRGDVLELLARVERTDPADGGGLTLRAVEAELLAPAVVVQDPVHWRQVGAAIALALLAGGLTLRDRLRRR